MRDVVRSDVSISTRFACRRRNRQSGQVRGVRWIVAVGAVMALHACGSDSVDDAGSAPRPTCSTFYRESVSVAPDDGPVLTFATPGSSEASFTDLHLTATYSDDGYESPSLNVRVETLPDRALVFASLYQFADPTADLTAFAATGQGFTGLIYVYNPASGSELQFVCSAD